MWRWTKTAMRSNMSPVLERSGECPACHSKLVDLVDHPKLVNQLASLERRTARGGRDSIDHAPGAHDDIANVVGGVVCAIASGFGNASLEVFWP
jgi:hypothetical protein